VASALDNQLGELPALCRFHLQPVPCTPSASGQMTRHQAAIIRFDEQKIDGCQRYRIPFIAFFPTPAEQFNNLFSQI
jgi:hypothetical protein